MLVPLAACSNDRHDIYDQGAQLAQQMATFAQNEEYITMIGATGEAAEVIHAIGDGNYDEPATVFAVEFSTDKLMRIENIDSYEQLPEEIRKMLDSKICFNLSSAVISAKQGTSAVAAMGLTTVSHTFVNKSVEDNLLYIYTYDDGYSVMVSFVAGEDNTVTATGHFLPNKDFCTQDADKMEELLSLFDATVTEVTR